MADGIQCTLCGSAARWDVSRRCARPLACARRWVLPVSCGALPRVEITLKQRLSRASAAPRRRGTERDGSSSAVWKYSGPVWLQLRCVRAKSGGGDVFRYPGLLAVFTSAGKVLKGIGGGLGTLFVSPASCDVWHAHAIYISVAVAAPILLTSYFSRVFDYLFKHVDSHRANSLRVRCGAQRCTQSLKCTRCGAPVQCAAARVRRRAS